MMSVLTLPRRAPAGLTQPEWIEPESAWPNPCDPFSLGRFRCRPLARRSLSLTDDSLAWVRDFGEYRKVLMANQFMSQLRLRASPPAVPPGLVRRRRLEALLSRGTTQPVTLLSAGPGSGKPCRWRPG